MTLSLVGVALTRVDCVLFVQFLKKSSERREDVRLSVLGGTNRAVIVSPFVIHGERNLLPTLGWKSYEQRIVPGCEVPRGVPFLSADT